jgi:hypothetical protein
MTSVGGAYAHTVVGLGVSVRALLDILVGSIEGVK